MLWGGNPEKDALYLPITPARNDGKTVHKLTVREVPVDGFWSVTVYNSEGYLQPNPHNAYSVNSITAKEGPDGSVDHPVRRVRRQGPKLPADHASVELHRATLSPAREILDGTWRFPAGAACELSAGRGGKTELMYPYSQGVRLACEGRHRGGCLRRQAAGGGWMSKP